MSHSEASAPQNSSLNAFLFADIGIERNGSNLTVLSTLARVGKNPWAEAARWAQGPRAEAIGSLAASIADMPLDARALQDAKATAARLVLLLPQPATAPAGTTRIYLAMSAGMTMTHKPVAQASTLVEQSSAHTK